MHNNKFFDESADQSRVKTAIVTKYFWAWAKVIIPTAKKNDGRIAYIDLFAGPGRYKDGTMSTPLSLLETAIGDHDMCQMLVTTFNDKDQDSSGCLKREIAALPGIEKLHHKPVVHNFEVGDQIANLFANNRLVPTLFFVDPWGYKGLSLDLIGSVLRNWGSDCVFFFNYNRINMGLSNAAVRHHMNDLFGEERADLLRREIENLTPYERELTIVERLSEALQERGGRYVLPFQFRNATGRRTSHHLVFVSKHVRGYEIMKDIMARECTRSDQGVPTFAYNPADSRYPTLFELSRPLDDLEDMLLAQFAGRTIKMEDIYRRHHVGRRYIKRNYKDVLLKMEEQGVIRAVPSRTQRPKGTFADRVVVTFPPRAG